MEINSNSLSTMGIDLNILTSFYCYTVIKCKNVSVYHISHNGHIMVYLRSGINKAISRIPDRDAILFKLNAKYISIN